jgi:hypothetical protein
MSPKPISGLVLSHGCQGFGLWFSEAEEVDVTTGVTGYVKLLLPYPMALLRWQIAAPGIPGQECYDFPMGYFCGNLCLSRCKVV